MWKTTLPRVPPGHTANARGSLTRLRVEPTLSYRPDAGGNRGRVKASTASEGPRGFTLSNGSSVTSRARLCLFWRGKQTAPVAEFVAFNDGPVGPWTAAVRLCRLADTGSVRSGRLARVWRGRRSPILRFAAPEGSFAPASRFLFQRGGQCCRCRKQMLARPVSLSARRSWERARRLTP